MKRKSFFAILLCVMGTIFNLYFSTILNLMLMKNFKSVPTRLKYCLIIATSNQKHLVLFLCFEIFILLMIALMNITKFKEFSGEVMQITPDIKTPVPTGNFEHGSSRWLKKSEYKRVFGSYVLKFNKIKMR